MSKHSADLKSVRQLTQPFAELYALWPEFEAWMADMHASLAERQSLFRKGSKALRALDARSMLETMRQLPGDRLKVAILESRLEALQQRLADALIKAFTGPIEPKPDWLLDAVRGFLPTSARQRIIKAYPPAAPRLVEPGQAL
jgi:hypothetical protein